MGAGVVAFVGGGGIGLEDAETEGVRSGTRYRDVVIFHSAQSKIFVRKLDVEVRGVGIEAAGRRAVTECQAVPCRKKSSLNYVAGESVQSCAGLLDEIGHVIKLNDGSCL